MHEIKHKEAIENIEYYFEKLIIEIFRGVANSKKRNFDAAYCLVKMAQMAIESDKLTVQEFNQRIDRVITRVSEAIESDELLSHVLQSSLRFAAELNATDKAAEGRASQRRETLTNAMSNYESRMLHLRSMNSPKTNRFTIHQRKT